MPKKASRNSYYYFMLDFKEEQRKKGITYVNMSETQQAADPVWRTLTTDQKAKYQEIATREKAKNIVPEKKYTTLGVPFSEIERQQRAVQEAEESELKEIKNFVKLKGFNKAILDEDIFIIDVNTFCHINKCHLFGESTVLRFNLSEGIKDYYHESINPGKIPCGYASDVKLAVEELGIEFPDEDRRVTDFIQVLANIIDYLKRNCRDTKVLPPIYTMPEKVEKVQDFIYQMCEKAVEDYTIFRIYKLDTLFFYLINEIKTHQNEGFPKMTLATAQLRKDLFKYTSGLSCELHEEGTKQVECTLSRVKRWAYTVMDIACPVTGIEPVPGNHLPHNVDVDTVLQTKETKKELFGAAVPRRMTASLNESFASSLSIDHEEEIPVQKPKEAPKRQYTRLREPKKNYLADMRPAPELSETNFPTLTSSAGRGRGRGFSPGCSYSSIAGGHK